MPYLFRLRIQDCAEAGCHMPGNYEVRGGVPPKLPAPRCLRHAKLLADEFEREEAVAAATPDAAREGSRDD